MTVADNPADAPRHLPSALFSDTEMPLVKENHEKDDKYESARFDVSLYSKNNKDDLLTHVEFKYGNPDKKSGICKDF